MIIIIINNGIISSSYHHIISHIHHSPCWTLDTLAPQLTWVKPDTLELEDPQPASAFQVGPWGYCWGQDLCHLEETRYHGIGWWEIFLSGKPINLMVKTHGFPVQIFPTKPIQWRYFKRGISTNFGASTPGYMAMNRRDLEATRALRWLSGNLYFIRQCERALSSGSLASEMLLSVEPGWEIIFFCDGNLSTRGFSSAKWRSQLESTLALLSCHLQKPKVLPARRIAPKNRCSFDVGYSFKRDGYCCLNPLIQVGSKQLAQRCISAAARAKASGRCKRQIRYPVHMTCVLYPGV